MENLTHRRTHLSKPAGTKLRTLLCMAFFVQAIFIFYPAASTAKKRIPCKSQIKSTDSFLVATPQGKILFEKNAHKQRVPASTLKVLTALAALNHFGPSYTFKTDFYMDATGSLIIKGYGDPLLVSEVLHQISAILASRINAVQNIILDDSYFASQIAVPGCDNTTNPYDAPIGARRP